MRSGPLGLAHHLLNVVPLPFVRISSEVCEHMQLKTVSKAVRECGHLPVVICPFPPAHESRSCIPQQIQSHRVCGWLDRRFLRSSYILTTASSCIFLASSGISWVLASSSISWVWTISTLQAFWSSLEPKPLDWIDLSRFSRVPANLSRTVLATFLHCTLSLFLLMRCRTAMTCAQHSLLLHQEKTVIVKMVPSRSLTFRLSYDSCVVTKSEGGKYGVGGQLLSSPFSHSESFKPLGFLRMVVIFGVLPEFCT